MDEYCVENYDKITDSELNQLDCPSYKFQENEWSKTLRCMNQQNLTKLCKSVNLDLIKYEIYKNSSGLVSKIFILSVYQNELILRVSNPHPFWKNKRTQSQVSIMKYLKENTNIPVPLILSYSCDSETSLIGCEYILMEKLHGFTVKSLCNDIKNPSEFNDSILDQIIDIYKTLKFLKPSSINFKQIGCFDSNLRITTYLQDGPSVDICDNYLDFTDKQLIWVIKEMKKIKMFQNLANDLEKFRINLIRVVEANESKLNRLNFQDEMEIFHGDLNSTNILIDINTFKITGVIDWDFCSNGYDNVNLNFLFNWFDKNINLEQVMKTKIDDKIKSLEWFKVPIGYDIRKTLYELTQNAIKTVFYLSSWYHGYENAEADIKIYMIECAILVDKFLKESSNFLRLIENF